MIKIECGKCLGRGFIRAYGHIKRGVCFQCAGHGYKLVKKKPVPPKQFKVHFLWLNEDSPNYRDGEFCHCWNMRARTKGAIEKKAKAALAKNGAVDFIVEEVA